MSQDASWLVLVSYFDPGRPCCGGDNVVAGTCGPVLLGWENPPHPLPVYLTVTNLPPPLKCRVADNMYPGGVGKCLYLFLNKLISN